MAHLSEKEKWLAEMAKVEAKKAKAARFKERLAEADELPTLGQRILARFFVRVDKVLRR